MRPGACGVGTRALGSSVLTPGDGDPPTPLGLRARARPPGAKSPFYLLPETGGAGPPGPPCVWGVGGCVQSMRVCVCVCVCARAVVTAPRWAALVHVCERKWSWLCLLSCPAPQGLTPAAPRTLSPPGTQGPGRPAPPGSCLAARCPVGWGHSCPNICQGSSNEDTNENTKLSQLLMCTGLCRLPRFGEYMLVIKA